MDDDLARLLKQVLEDCAKVMLIARVWNMKNYDKHRTKFGPQDVLDHLQMIQQVKDEITKIAQESLKETQTPKPIEWALERIVARACRDCLNYVGNDNDFTKEFETYCALPGISDDEKLAVGLFVKWVAKK